MEDARISLVPIENPEELNFILGQTHFIKTVEDLYEAMVQGAPTAKFGIAFSEASGPGKIRVDGNDEGLKALAVKNASSIGAGHTFLIFMKGCFPVTVLNAIKDVPEVCSLFCATANPTKVVVCETTFGKERARGILGVVDGLSPKGVETSEEASSRHELLRKFGYKR
jgi:uncharacterized protein